MTFSAYGNHKGVRKVSKQTGWQEPHSRKDHKESLGALPTTARVDAIAHVGPLTILLALPHLFFFLSAS